MRVVLTASARSEIRGIGRWIAQDDPSTAATVVRELTKRCFALSDTPQRGVVIAVRHGREIRRLVHRPYLIVYSVSGELVRIHRIVHGARSPRTLLKGLDPF